MIEVQGLTRRYGDLVAIDDVTFRVNEGEVMGFLGPNAAGKTTTMRILTGYLAPHGGRAAVAGHDVVHEPLEARRSLGYLPENVPLYPEMSVASYLYFMAGIRGVPRRQRKDRIDEVLSRCGLDDREGDLLGKLSKGYRQRVGIAQALVHDPPVLILDEPTEGLDPKQILEVRQLIRSMAGHRTIILCSHILPEVQMTCERVVIINRGRTIAEGTPQELQRKLTASDTVDVKVRGERGEIEPVIAGLNGILSVRGEQKDGLWVGKVETTGGDDLCEEIARVVVQKGWGLLEMTPQKLSLEDIFLELTTEEHLGEDQ
jgi:ABC-2 type transport system ATP-binding protein